MPSLGFGLVTIDHVAPFQCSISVRWSNSRFEGADREAVRRARARDVEELALRRLGRERGDRPARAVPALRHRRAADGKAVGRAHARNAGEGNLPGAARGGDDRPRGAVPVLDQRAEVGFLRRARRCRCSRLRPRSSRKRSSTTPTSAPTIRRRPGWGSRRASTPRRPNARSTFRYRSLRPRSSS